MKKIVFKISFLILLCFYCFSIKIILSSKHESGSSPSCIWYYVLKVQYGSPHFIHVLALWSFTLHICRIWFNPRSQEHSADFWISVFKTTSVLVPGSTKSHYLSLLELWFLSLQLSEDCNPSPRHFLFTLQSGN